VTFLPLSQPQLVLDLETKDGCKAELTWLAGYIYIRYTRSKTVTHPGTNRARRGLTSLMRRTPLTTTPRCQPRQHISLTTTTTLAHAVRPVIYYVFRNKPGDAPKIVHSHAGSRPPPDKWFLWPTDSTSQTASRLGQLF